MAKANKLSAAARTVDMFTRLTAEQVQKQSEAEAEALKVQEDIADAPKPAEAHSATVGPIEVSADKWRDNAFTMQEFVSKSFGKGDSDKGVYRLTEQNGWLFLEQFRLGKDGKAYHWAGLMFPSSDVNELANVFLKAAKEKANGNS